MGPRDPVPVLPHHLGHLVLQRPDQQWLLPQQPDRGGRGGQETGRCRRSSKSPSAPQGGAHLESPSWTGSSASLLRGWGAAYDLPSSDLSF